MSAIPGFIGGAYQGANPVSANETCINWYASAVETPNGTTPVELLPVPGLLPFATAVASGCRGAWFGDGRCFVVFGDTLLEVAADGTLTSRGTLAIDGRPATFSTNGDAGNQLLITSGGNAYCYDLTTNTLTQVVTGGVIQGGVVDGYGVVLITTPGAVQFRISELFDLLTWDPTQFAQRSISPDLWQAMLVDPYGYITLLGSKTGESWSNVGAFPFPFAPDRAGLIEEGIAAPFSLRQAGKHKVWLSTNGNGGYQVMAAQGFTARRISTHGLEHQIASYATVDDALGETYEQEGHAFYLLTFPSAGVTWVYDFSTRLWHRRGTFVNGTFTYWRPVFHVFAFGKLLAGDRDATAIYEVSAASVADVTGSLVRERAFYAGGAENQPVFFDYLAIHAQPGVGLTSGADEDTDPHLMIGVSNDYGESYPIERTAPLGKVGERDRKCDLWGLGQGTGRYYRIRGSAAVPMRLTAAYQRVRQGAPLQVA